jgi:hypothetical protein
MNATMTNPTTDTTFLFDRVLFALKPGGAIKKIAPAYAILASLKADPPPGAGVERHHAERHSGERHLTERHPGERYHGELDAERWDGLS